jgi:hypothetical protein
LSWITGAVLWVSAKAEPVARRAAKPRMYIFMTVLSFQVLRVGMAVGGLAWQ